MGNFESFARDELQRAGLFDKDSDYGGKLGDAVMDLVRKFAEQKHSGFSARMAATCFEKIVRFEPLTPLTGEDDEWYDPCGDGLLQNKRCPRVFKDRDGRAFDAEGKVFLEPDGVCFTNGESHVFIDFPYVPKTEIVDIAAR